MMNSTIVAVASTALSLLLGVPAAYAIARYKMGKAKMCIRDRDEKVRSLWKQSVIQFKHNRLAVVGLVIIVLFIVTILTTLAVDQITNYSFYNEYILKQDLSLRLAKPSLAHPFGCDEFGRDLLLRILWGTKLSFAIGVVAIALSVIMGCLLYTSGLFSIWQWYS